MRIGRTAALAVVAAGAAILTGCPPTYPKCGSDEHCKEHGEVCVQGQCQECATDANCKEGFTCVSSRCVPKPECAADADCGTGRVCRAGKCVAEAAGRPPGCKADADCGSGEECQAGTCVPKAAPAETCDFSPVRFDFNEHRLTSEAQGRLSGIADCIKREKLRVTLEGHADERGTEEYNLQLSNRRAASVKRYLVDLGVSSGSLETVGFGEERPAAPGAGESAWSANRRVELNRR